MDIPKKKRFRYKLNAIRLSKEYGEEIDQDNWDQIWAIIEKYGEPDYLYAIVDHQNGVVKFGKSKDPNARFKTIKTGNPQSIKIWAYCKQESPYTEKEVHRLLKDYRVYGEWFKLNAIAMQVINGIRGKAGVHVSTSN